MAVRQELPTHTLGKPPLSDPKLTPRYFRELVREQFTDANIRRLHEIAMGEATFSIPVAIPPGKGEPGRVEMVDCEAPAMVQAICAKALVELAIPKQMGLVDGDDKGFTGVIQLPALDRAEPVDADYEIVEEEVGPDNMSLTDDRDVAPPALEETVPPAFVAHVLAKQKNGRKR